MPMQEEYPGSILNWIAGQPLDVAFILIVLPIMLLAMTGTLLVRGVFGLLIAPGSSVGQAKAGAAAEVYAVVLGFIIVIGFSDFQDAKRDVLQEATALNRLAAQAKVLDVVTASKVTEAVGVYATAVVDHEWPAMKFGRASSEANEKIVALNDLVMTSAGQDNALLQIRLSFLLDEVIKLRVSRLSASPDPLVAGLIFQVLVLGAALALITGWFVRGPQRISAYPIVCSAFGVCGHGDDPVGTTSLSIHWGRINFSRTIHGTGKAVEGLESKNRCLAR